ncbi:Increased rDNA silencing protein 4 [Leucoagaricus sp. SymC.cos]|nr:Increased rDNA silencing protein 4 [Leucoagaricus sp. SymC.cos]
MPPSAVQSRIAALEAAARNATQPSAGDLDHKTSLIDLHDWVLDDMPPTPPSQPQPSSPPKQKPKPKPKPPALQVKPPAGVKKSPPLPPRRSTTVDSTTSDTSFLYPPLGGIEAKAGENGARGNHVAASSVSSFHSVSLSSDNGTDPETPSSVGTSMIATYPIDRVSSTSSLTESFEEISIPAMQQSPLTPTKPPLPQRPTTVPPSLNIAPAQPTPLPYVPRRVPPPPPSTSRDRSSMQSVASASSSTSRRSSASVIHTPIQSTTLPLPPPPFILSPTSSGGTTPSSVILAAKTKRPTPVPSAARKRYTSVFNANVIQRRCAEVSVNGRPKKLSHAEAKRTRQAAGWRGLSVDLITATPEELLAHEKGKEKANLVVDENVGPDERLEGSIVKVIWSRSRIEKSKLAEIWSECDPENKGSLDANSFVRGMWRIDEHLRRTQSQTSSLRNASSLSLTSLRSGFGSLKIKSGRPGGELHRSTSRSSLGTSLSRSSSVTSSSRNHGASTHAEYPPMPSVPKIVLR